MVCGGCQQCNPPEIIYRVSGGSFTDPFFTFNPPLQPLYPRRSDASDAKAALVLPLVFRPRQLAKVLTTPPVGPPQKKEEAV